MPSSTTASSRPSAGAMDAQRKADTVLAIRARALDVYQWVSGVLQWSDAGQPMSVNDDNSAATVERFFARLASGVELCHLLDTLSSSAHRVTHVQEDATAGSFQARDNIARFIKSAQALGVSALVCFDTDDLALRQNDKKVVNTLMELSRQSAIKYNVAPTKLMQFDMEWDELQLQRSSQQQNQAQQQQQAVAGKADEDDEHEVEESVMTATAQRYETEEKEQAPSTHSSIIPTTTSAAAGKPARPAALSAHDNDAIDAAISSLISQHHFAIPITRVAIKSKKRRRDARKAEYRVGSGPKLFVRLLHGHLIAKADEEWVDFAEAVQDRIRLEIAARH